jgi:hypothetical protein
MPGGTACCSRVRRSTRPSRWRARRASSTCWPRGWACATGASPGEVETPFCFGAGKVAVAEAWAARHDVDLDTSAFFTDSISDLPMLERVGEPVVVNPDLRLGWEARRPRVARTALVARTPARRCGRPAALGPRLPGDGRPLQPRPPRSGARPRPRPRLHERTPPDARSAPCAAFPEPGSIHRGGPRAAAARRARARSRSTPPGPCPWSQRPPKPCPRQRPRPPRCGCFAGAARTSGYG